MYKMWEDTSNMDKEIKKIRREYFCSIKGGRINE